MKRKRITRKSSTNWHQTHQRDEFVRRASRIGVRSRSYFKLEQLDQKFKLLRKGQRVLDLGAAPGGWSQYALTRVDEQGKVFACDILNMQPLNSVYFIQCNLLDNESIASLTKTVGGKSVDLIMSDMAPNITGNSSIDERNFSDLHDAIFELCELTLVRSGSLVFKLFQNEQTASLKKGCAALFSFCQSYKPSASRAKSKELYIVAKGHKN